MVVFTFVNNGQGGYLIAADRTAMGWRGLPYDLDREMEDVRRKGEEVEEVSMGLDGDWFLRTSARHACKTEYVQAGSISNVEKFVQLLQQAGLTLTDYAVQFFTFMPDPTGYVTVLHKTDSSLTRCAWRNVPPELDTILEREGQKGVRHVTVGANGAYVVILNSGAMWWGADVPRGLHQLLEDAETRRRPVTTVSLSLVSPNCYFVRFADGGTEFALPPDWHQSVNHYSAQVKLASALSMMGTSVNPGMHRAQTYPQYAPQLPQAQLGSHSPGSPVSLSPDPGYKHFQSSPYLSSAFTGTPQQPVYITQVYNPVPQPQLPQLPQQQQSTASSLSKYNGMFTLLGGALKLAGSALDWSSSVN